MCYGRQNHRPHPARNGNSAILHRPVCCDSAYDSAQNTTYAMTNSGVFGTLNLSNGTFTQIGNSAIQPAGMAGLGGSLYVALYEGSTLYRSTYRTGT